MPLGANHSAIRDPKSAFPPAFLRVNNFSSELLEILVDPPRTECSHPLFLGLSRDKNPFYEAIPIPTSRRNFRGSCFLVQLRDRFAGLAE